MSNPIILEPYSELIINSFSSTPIVLVLNKMSGPAVVSYENVSLHNETGIKNILSRKKILEKVFLFRAQGPIWLETIFDFHYNDW